MTFRPQNAFSIGPVSIPVEWGLQDATATQMITT